MIGMNEVVPINPTPDDMARHIRRIAEDSNNIIFTGHARQRMQQRKITSRHVITCLREGSCDNKEWPYQNESGEWCCRMIRKVAGLEVTLAVAVNWNKNIIIITTY